MSGNAGELWQKYIETTIDLPALGFRLDISRMNVDKHFLRKMEGQLQEALTAMAALEAGAIANPDEGRMVGHYWLRAPELAPDKSIGVMIREARAAIERFVQAVHGARLRPERAERFTDVILVGIGGSALGPQLVSDALGSHRDRMQLHFVDNTDPDGIDRLLLKLGSKLASTLTLVVSKSGGTVETRNGMLELESAYERLGLNFVRHAVAVTSEGSLLDGQAKKEGWLDIFPMWDWVGGRTSVMSAVGLLPARLQGIDVDAMLLGAAEMDKITRGTVVAQNPAAMLAAMWWHAGQGRGQKDMVILPYKDRLLLFSRYLQQLVMESLGKERDMMGKVVEQGIAVYGNKGSTDQHAYVQQLRDGVHNFFVTFLEVLKDRDGDSMEVAAQVTSGDYLLGFFLGTRAALTEKGRESMTVTLRDISPFSLGALIALYERAVGLYASLAGINAYHQPGVEAGKKAANKVMDLQRMLAQVIRNGASGRAAELAAAVPGPPDWETTLKVLEHLAANGRIRRTAGASPWDAVFSRL